MVKKKETIESQLQTLRVGHFFGEDKKPVSVLHLKAAEKLIIEISDVNGVHIGVFVVNGYDIRKKYTNLSSLVSLTNVVNADEYLATFHSASRSFTAENGMIRLTVENLTKENIVVVPYVSL